MQEKFFWKSLCRELSHSAKNEPFHIFKHWEELSLMLILYRMLLPMLINESQRLKHALPISKLWLGFRLSAPYLNTCIAYFNTLSRLHTFVHASYFIESAPYLNTMNRHDSSGQHPRQPIRIEYSVTRVVMPNRIEHYVTESSRLGLKTLLGSRIESARFSLS